MKKAALCVGASACAVITGASTFTRAGGYDLFLYKRMARTALSGANPFADPFADFPPLKMGMFIAIQHFGVWPLALTIIAAAHAGLAALYLARRYKTPTIIAIGLIPCVVPAVFFASWYRLWEDKGIYPILLLGALLIVPDGKMGRVNVTRPIAVAAGIFVGLLQAYGGAGILLVPIIGLAAATDTRRRLTDVTAAAGTVLVASHLAWFPGWIEGYAHRLNRSATHAPYDASIFRLLVPLHLYTHLLTPALTILSAAAIGSAYRARRLGVHQTCALLAATVMLIGPDMGYERILAGLAPLILVTAHRWKLVAPAVAALGVIGVLSGGASPTTNAQLVVYWIPVALVLCAVVLDARSDTDEDFHAGHDIAEGQRPDEEGLGARTAGEPPLVGVRPGRNSGDTERLD